MSISYRDDWLTIYGGDCRTVLAELPDESVHCVVTSPPYWGLRDYGITDQLGLEPTPEQYVENMVAVFREVRRVLRSDGTVWLNLGDSYAANGVSGLGVKGESSTLVGTANAAHTAQRKEVPSGLKPKDLVGIPWRVAFALQADGWYLRSDVIWSKPNPMPESVTDRPTKSHEYVFLLAKSPRYYFDVDAVREPQQSIGERHEGKSGYREGHPSKGGITQRALHPAGRNVRTVWTVATQPYPGAHFAVFPEKLIEPCILAGTSEKGVCPECGKPWRRVVETSRTFESGSGRAGNLPVGKNGAGLQGGGETGDIRRGPTVSVSTIGWEPSCGCDDGWNGPDWDPTMPYMNPVPATVLDPFGGSGTTARVANRLSRRAVLIDLNPDYLRQQMDRNRDLPLGLGA